MISEASRLLSQDYAIYFLTLANLLYVVCYGVRDVLWLRIFCVTAILTIMPYYVWGTESVQMSCVNWNLVFLAINLYWIIVIIKQRQPPKMTEKQKRLYADVFEHSFSPQEMLKLLSIGRWIDCNQGDFIVENGSDPKGLALIDNGHVNVILADELVARLGRGDFVGEMSYLTGAPAVADVVAADSVQFIRWDKEELKKLFDRDSELKSAVNEIVGRDLVQKLASSETKIPELSVETVVYDSK